MTLNEKLATIQTELKAKKSRFNSFGRYNYRSAEDILEAVKPFLLKLKVNVTINETLKEIAGIPVMESQASLSDGDSEIIAQAIVGVDMNQKGMNVPQQFGSASSYGKKYALGNLFLIDDTADSDATNTHGTTSKKTKSTLTSEKDPAFPKAVDFIKKGGKLETIKAKYDLSNEIETKLKTL
jgi:hypothetical protein